MQQYKANTKIFQKWRNERYSLIHAILELRHLRYFVGVAEMENVSRAALKLHVSQSALSAQIRDLEHEMRFLLFERTAKSVRLTKAGWAFLDEARAVLQRADQAVKKARTIADTEPSELHIGYTPAPFAQILPKILRAFQQAMPSTNVKLHEWSYQGIRDGLRDGRLQLGLIVPPPKASSRRDLRYEELFHTRACVVVAPNHPFARRRAILLTEIAAEPLIGPIREDHAGYYDHLSVIFSKVKRKPQVVEQHESISGIISAVEAGTGVMIGGDIYRYTFGKRVKLLHLIPEPKPFSIGIAAPKGRLSPAAEKFWQCAKETAAK